MNRLHTALILFAGTTTAFAQISADRAIATTRTPGFRTSDAVLNKALKRAIADRAPELYPGEIDDVGPQFLVLRDRLGADGKATIPPPHRWVEGFADIQLFYTSNALLTEKGNQDTGVMVFTVQAAITPPPFPLAGGTASARLGYRHQWWLYSLDNTANQLNNFDFAVSTAFVSLRNSWDDRWVATLGLDYNRYLAHDNEWAEFYTELTPTWSIERNIPLGEKCILTAGYYGAWHWTQTDPLPVKHINDRLDTALGLTVTAELLPRFLAQAYYRLQWSHYSENSDRNDMYHNLGLALIYAFNDWASVRTFVSWENRNSTDPIVADYQTFNAGGGLMFSARY